MSFYSKLQDFRSFRGLEQLSSSICYYVMVDQNLPLEGKSYLSRSSKDADYSLVSKKT